MAFVNKYVQLWLVKLFFVIGLVNITKVSTTADGMPKVVQQNARVHSTRLLNLTIDVTIDDTTKKVTYTLDKHSVCIPYWVINDKTISQIDSSYDVSMLHESESGYSSFAEHYVVTNVPHFSENNDLCKMFLLREILALSVKLKITENEI